eukprot:CAMPEP_0178991422 /NCGR_PEP_ID=MMETSP0795-20121207/5518_1 /TAXON_ID=88552 /ORGANISM="Amoebophrya sp., Strain Ameob2" /LENGTH=52 /DNA_ID=CAMNT_0020683127 /DNA_START=61 /DNA_END=220 /DNA_ORIENTATION=-
MSMVILASTASTMVQPHLRSAREDAFACGPTPMAAPAAAAPAAPAKAKCFLK